VALCNTDGRLYAIGDACSHAGVRLSEGWLYDGRVECALHGALFDVGTGAVLAPPATAPIPTYEVRVEGDNVYVALPG
jgi:3-phenylpropionate/trans-cinnamate dioxygenase ferredoxin subunit